MHPVQKAQGTVARPKLKRSSRARSGESIKVSARDGQSYADILREMKAKVDPRRAGFEVLSIRGTRKEEVLLVLKKGGDVSAFPEELDRAVEEKPEISALVSTRSLEIRDLDETVEKEEVVSVLCLALGRPVLDGSCRLFNRFGGVKTAVMRLAYVRSTTAGLHLDRSYKATPRCLTCLDRGDKDIAHVSDGGSCPVFREELRTMRGRN